MSEINEALSKFDENDYTVKLCRTMFAALPTAPPFVFYRDLAGGVARVSPGASRDLVGRATEIAARREAERALWLAGALDKADKGLAVAAGVSNLFAMMKGKSGNGRSTFESDRQQAIDAGIKLLGLAYIASRLFPGNPAEKVKQLLDLPAGREAALYLAAVEIALPFMDNFLESGSSTISRLMDSSAVDAAARFGGVAGRSTTEEASSVLSHLVQPLEHMLEGVKGSIGGLVDTVRSHLPSALGFTDSATGALATALDAMPVWQFLGARIVAEAAARRAMIEQASEAPVLERVSPQAALANATESDLLLETTTSGMLAGTGALVGTGALLAASSFTGADGDFDSERHFESGPRSMWRTYVRFVTLALVAVGIAWYARTYPDSASAWLDRVRAQQQWLGAVGVGLLGLVMFRLGIDTGRDWPVALGATVTAGSLAVGQAVAGRGGLVIAGSPDTPFVLPVALLLVLLAIGSVRLKN